VEVTLRPVQQKYTATDRKVEVPFRDVVRAEGQCKRLPPVW
jgi:hypothetical protein